MDLSAYIGAGMIGFDIPEGIVMDNITLPGEPDWGQPVLVENTPSYTFDNLSLGTSYEVRVQAVCAVDDVSDWVETQFNTPLCVPENQCAITYIIGDDYGDGWTGNTINIVEAASGIVVASITMEDHNVAGQYVEDSGTLPLCPGSYDFVWVSGEWADECSFILYDPNGNEIVSFESGKSGPESGSLLGTPYQHTCEGSSYELEVVGYDDSEGGYYLIDNLTGADVDLLATPSYSFNAKTTDYASRFKLVFVAAEGEANDDETFAFFNGSEWLVSNVGVATLQVVDVLGHVLSSETVKGNASVNINEAAGVYVMRLIKGNVVKTQKIIIK